MKQPFFIFTILSLIFLNAYSASAVSLTATVDKTEATLEDSIQLTLSVEGARSGGKPILPRELKSNFQVQSRGSSSRVQIINGKINAGIDYNYLLYPKKTGTFTISPATIVVKGKKYESQAFTLHILPVQKEISPSRDIFITSEVNKRNPYLNEQLIYTFRFFRSVKVMNPHLLGDINFQGFYIEKLGKEKEYSTIRNGKEYLVTELRQALFPTETGMIEIPSVRLEVDVVYRSQRRGFFSAPFFDDPFFGFNETRSKVLVAPAVTLNVKPLPEEGKPVNFSKLVGDFTISSNLGKKRVKVGDSMTLTITVSGYGNIWDAVGPELSNLPNVKVYSDKPTLTKKVQEGRIYGMKTLKEALVPLKEGKIRIPPLKIAFFNPDLEQYQHIMTKPILLNVLPSSEKEKLHLVEASGLNQTKHTVNIIGKGLLPIHTSINALENQAFNPFNILYCLIIAIPVVAYVTGLGVKKRNDRLINDQGFRRRHKAMSNFGKSLKKVEPHLKDEPSEAFYRLTSRAIKEYLGDKINLIGNTLTPQEAEKKLSERGVNPELLQKIRTLLENLEKGQYASAFHSPQEREEILKSAKKIVKTLEKRLR